jgi:hypothetical protein
VSLLFPEPGVARLPGPAALGLRELQPRRLDVPAGPLGVRRPGAQRRPALRPVQPRRPDLRRRSDRSADRQAGLARQGADVAAPRHRLSDLGPRRLELPLRLDLPDAGAQLRVREPRLAIERGHPRQSRPAARDQHRLPGGRAAPVLEGRVGPVLGVLQGHLRAHRRAPGA